MAEESKQKPSIKPNKPNYQIWIVTAIVTVVVGITFFTRSGSAVTISYNRFEQMLLGNDVAKVVLIKNQDVVEVTLKTEALSNAKYSKELENRGPMSLPGGPHYKFRIADPKTFDDDFDQAVLKCPTIIRLVMK